MRFWIASGLTLCFAYACSSTTTKVAEPGDGGAAGNPAAEGGSPARGGTNSVGGSGGRAPAVAGAPFEASGGEGGVSQGSSGSGGDSGPDEPGGTSAIAAGSGGTSGSAGTDTNGGMPGCVRPTDCPNPHRETCTVSCVEGLCQVAPSNSLSTAIQSGPRDAAPRSGVWDAKGNAYLVYPTIATTPNGINLHELDEEGALVGIPNNFDMLPEVAVVDMVAAAFAGERLGLLWHGTTEEGEVPGAGFDITEFAVTDLSLATTTPIRLHARRTYDAYPDDPFNLLLLPRAANEWMTVVYSGTGPRWRATIVDPSSPPTDEPLQNGLENAPYSVAPRASVKGIAQGHAIIDGKLFVTGYDCEWANSDICQPMLVFQAFDLETLMPLSDTFVTISTSSYPVVDLKQRPPALAKLRDKLAVLWTQYSDAGALLLGRAVFETDGTIATQRRVEASDLIPKAIIESPAGGALLIASRVDSSGTEPVHTLVGQRLDAELDFIGEAHPLSPAGLDPTEVQLAANSDGRVLLTFRQQYAQHRIIHADLCQ